MKNFLKALVLSLFLTAQSFSAVYLIVRDADNVVTNVTSTDPGAAPALHTKYNETPSSSIIGWNIGAVVKRTGVNTYINSSAPFQLKSFAVDDSDDSKLVLERLYGTKFDFSTAFTIIIPFKADWLTGPTTTYLFDWKTSFYVYMGLSGTRLSSRQFDATTNETIHTTSFTALADGDWVWVGLTYDGAGGYQFIVNDALLANTGVKSLVNNTESFRFGERWGYTVTQDMTMGNILILNKVISAGELTTYYNNGKGVDAYSVFADTEIVHYYCADNFEGQTTVPDSSGVSATKRGALAEKGLLTTTDVPN